MIYINIYYANKNVIQIIKILGRIIMVEHNNQMTIEKPSLLTINF